MSLFPFVGAAYTARSVNSNAQRLVNLYPEIEPSGKQVMALYGTPGLRLLATATAADDVRGMWATTQYLYVVSGNKLSKFTTSWTETTLGTLNTSSGPVSIAANPTQLMLVDGTDGYILTVASDTFATISDADFPASPRRVGFLDGYFIVDDANTQRFYISDLNAGASWDALDFASAEGDADLSVSLIVDHRELWLFGEKTTEVWIDSGASDFPFERVQGAFIEHGCAAVHSVAKLDNSVFWLGADDKGAGIVWRANGYTPQRVSTHAVEHAIRDYATVSDAIAYTYQDEGHSFYVLIFPAAGATWVFDAATSLWHERAYRNTSTGALGRHRSNCHAYFDRQHVVGDFENGKLYELDLDTYSDNGDPLIALRACRHFAANDELANLFHHRLQIDIEAGVGLITGQGSDPQIMLRWSDDGGHTWSSYHYRDMGAIGEYTRRALWNRLGKSRDRIYEASISDPVKRVIIGANLRVTKGVA